MVGLDTQGVMYLFAAFLSIFALDVFGEGPAGELHISDGKVDGDESSFKVKFEDNVIDHQGKVVGDTINMKVQGPWGESEMSLERAPNE